MNISPREPPTLARKASRSPQIPPSTQACATPRNHFRFNDINGTVVSDADAQFKDKVVILAIGGTWCPNCRDEAPFLVDLYKRFHRQGLEIVGLNFEATGDPEEDKPRIASFIKEFSVPYPILYAGAIPDVKAKLPQIT